MPLLVHERDAYRTVTEGIAAWLKFFAIRAESELLTGKAKAQPGMPPFIADIDFLFAPQKFAKCIDDQQLLAQAGSHVPPVRIHGFELNDNYAKKTCLWTGGGFVMPEKQTNRYLGEPDNRIHAAHRPTIAPTSEVLRRWELRGPCLPRLKNKKPRCSRLCEGDYL